MTSQNYSLTTTSMRDGVSVAFRHKKLVLICAGLTVLAAVLAALLLPRYHAEAKLLVDRERVDPILSPTPEMSNYAMAAQPVVTDEDLRSEVELMKSTEVLTNVVKALDLAHPEEKESWWSKLTGGKQASDEERVSAKVSKLDHDLVVEPAKGSYIIDVVYKSKDRDLAKRVLNQLLQVYLAKHTEVHHPAGQYKFFEQAAEEYHKKMEAAQARLAAFPKADGAVEPEMDRGLTMQKLSELKYTLQETRAAAAEAEKRIQRLHEQERATPERITTQVRKADNPQLLEQLKSSLLTLELRRSDLLAKYQPDYRPVQELSQQIEQARAAIQKELNSPMGDTTTDVDPTHQMVRSELAKAETDLAGYRARAQATESIVNDYSQRVMRLDSQSLQQADLVRDMKTEEENYLLYRKKAEEARITDALDANRMVNISIAEQPIVPALPSHSPMFFGLLAVLTMVAASIGLIATLERADRTFHSSHELESYLNIPLLASVPHQLKTAGRSGELIDGQYRSGGFRIADGPVHRTTVQDDSDKGVL